MLIVCKFNSGGIESKKLVLMQEYNFLLDRWLPTLPYNKGFELTYLSYFSEPKLTLIESHTIVLCTTKETPVITV